MSRSPYVFFGTGMKGLEESGSQAGHDPNKFVPVWKQEAKDERGRKRFHGAFTGGFSAGYFNTVGSKEGFTPGTFVSHRGQKEGSGSAETAAVRRDAQLKAIMDDEDMLDLHTQTIQLKTEFASPAWMGGRAASEVTLRAASSLGKALLATLGQPPKRTPQPAQPAPFRLPDDGRTEREADTPFDAALMRVGLVKGSNQSESMLNVMALLRRPTIPADWQPRGPPSKPHLQENASVEQETSQAVMLKLLETLSNRTGGAPSPSAALRAPPPPAPSSSLLASRFTSAGRTAAFGLTPQDTPSAEPSSASKPAAAASPPTTSASNESPLSLGKKLARMTIAWQPASLLSKRFGLDPPPDSTTSGTRTLPTASSSAHTVQPLLNEESMRALLEDALSPHPSLPKKDVAALLQDQDVIDLPLDKERPSLDVYRRVFGQSDIPSSGAIAPQTAATFVPKAQRMRDAPLKEEIDEASGAPLIMQPAKLIAKKPPASSTSSSTSKPKSTTRLSFDPDE